MSRRDLFGAGLARLLETRVADEPTAPSRRSPAVAPATAGEADGRRLGSGLRGVAAHVLTLTGLAGAPAQSVAVVAAGDGSPAATSVAEAGHAVVAIEFDGALRARGAQAHPSFEWRAGHPARLPLADGEVQATIAWFGTSYEPDLRALAAELKRVTAPGGTIALLAWTAAARTLLVPEPGGHRPEQWSRYETAYRHFHGLPFDVVEAEIVVAPRPDEAATELSYAAVVVNA